MGRAARVLVSKMTSLVLLLLVFSAKCYSYVSESWYMLTSDRPSPTKCIEIPKNFTLCYDMQYTAMRLPNLLDHETLDEVIEQAEPWKSLSQLNCHPDTQGCESRMLLYGFPWPEMLSCKKFPADNDMCIRVVSGKQSGSNRTCPACSQVGTYENILDHYCHSQFGLCAPTTAIIFLTTASLHFSLHSSQATASSPPQK